MDDSNNNNNKCVSKKHISPYAQLIPGGVVHGPLKGTKHSTKDILRGKNS